ncbi:AAA family ATPase [Rhizobium sp. P44RR-XXIV]|uniref:AAA family ATPase n=1 Tax=Rhizobium sp. P44RR-XXIV TaxID=1921145 RepID=UPI000986A002|nr:AAA family ATPase [Rhizobium sp. P44RR-XXIV]TIX91606.1 ATP-dependent endonuclease [Rhizobium sp. P44RR-XXIV]
MLISQIEIANFRKLIAVRTDLSQKKTVFVGANNSGKTSAMTALRRFLVEPREFTVTDFTLSNWGKLNSIGEVWEAEQAAGLWNTGAQREEEFTATQQSEPILKGDEAELLAQPCEQKPTSDLFALLPQIDIWLDVKDGEMHYIKPLIPTLDWEKGLLGVRLRFEPSDLDLLKTEYCTIRARNAATLKSAAEADGNQLSLTLWPSNLMDFLERRLQRFFRLKAYLLDPSKLASPVDGKALPQALPASAVPLDGNPLEGLIKVNEINAQRGLGQQVAARVGADGVADAVEHRGGRKLSGQMRSYYDKHLDPMESPDVDDLKALQALSVARKTFDERLTECFSNALEELEGVGYPGAGFGDPKITIATSFRMQDGLDHASAVQYHVPTGSADAPPPLPEDSNGLGFQNLVSMVFALMSFRDGWMKVGKAGLTQNSPSSFPPPLHLVLVEEPEAHLHAQVQQVFMTHAYDVLRNHKSLKDNEKLTTQLIVSTHSSHIAHSSDFDSLRYFRRLPASVQQTVPTATVVNLKSVFGEGDKTGKFVTRYLKATHCDLFFADGAILIEGSAERILVPHFIEARGEFEYLKRCYISWLEIGGAHAHRLRGLIEHLGLPTLIVSDLDAKDKDGNAVGVARNTSQETRNETLRSWVPKLTGIDELLDLKDEQKALRYSSGFAVRIAYQTPAQIEFKAAKCEALAYTFEDALFYRNMEFFANRQANGLAGKFQRSISDATNVADLIDKVRSAIRNGGNKAEFALELLYGDDIDKLQVPEYIASGLRWFIGQLKVVENELAPKKVPAK